jgi:hypothetical protein
MAAKGGNQTHGKPDAGNDTGGKKRKGGFKPNGGNGPTNKGNNKPDKPNHPKKQKLIDGPSGRKLTRDQIQKLKAEGKCFACEGVGHRASDPECPKSKGKGKAKGSEN